EPRADLRAAQEMPEGALVRFDGAHLEIPALFGSAGFQDFAIDRREQAHFGAALAQMERGAVHFDAGPCGRQRDSVRRTDEARAEIVESDGDGAILFAAGPGVTAVIETVGREVHAEDLVLGACFDGMARDEGVVRLALAAIERMGTLAAGELAGEEVA